MKQSHRRKHPVGSWNRCTPEMKAQIIALHHQKLRPHPIAVRLGFNNNNSVRQVLQRAGLDPRANWLPVYRRPKIEAAIARGLTNDEIARETGATPDYVRRVRRKITHL